MEYIKITKENLEQARKEVLANFLAEKWLICCTAKNPEDLSTYTLQNVSRLELNGIFADRFDAPVFVEYGLSEKKDTKEGEPKFKIHDSMIAPIKDSKVLVGAIHNMTELFNVFIIDDGLIDREKLYGRLGTDKENEVVFRNETTKA